MADDIQVVQDPNDPTAFSVSIGGQWLVGQQAGLLRAAGIDIDPSIPDCALLESNDANGVFKWVEASFTIPAEDGPVVNLDDHRIRTEGEFKDESVAYIEALWGKSTFAFNVAVRDLEAMRRGTEEPGMPLRPPATYHEALHMIRHVRALANDIARHFGMDDEVRPGDELPKKKT